MKLAIIDKFIIDKLIPIAIGSLSLASWSIAADVKLESQQRATLGIETTTLSAVTVAREVQASAQVLDSSQLIATMGELRAAQLSAMSSRGELDRLERLHADDTNVSLKAVEAARAQTAADAGHVATLRAQLATTWGRSLVAFPDSERTLLLDELTSGRASLLRADVTDGDVRQLQFHSAKTHSLTSDETWPAIIIGRMASSNDRGIGDSYLLKVAADLQPNRMLVVQLIDPAHSRHGFKIPRGALIRWQGSDWVFEESADNLFTRHIVHPIQWLDDGCLVDDDLAQRHIVIVGAMMLLGMEGGATSEKSGAKED
jgi:hypothetical protein